MNKSYTILGGDNRSAKLYDLIIKDGNQVKITGFDKHEELKSDSMDLKEAISDSEVIIGPLPFSKDNINIDAPFSSKKIEIEEVLNLLNKNQLFLGGKVNKELEEKKVKIIDYFAREDMQILNAIPTAEGAIQVAMTELPITINDSKTMVLGYGRIGKVLSNRLNGIGTSLYVEARNSTDLAWISSNRYIPVHLKHLKTYLPKMNLVFNTIPDLILDNKLLRYIDKDCIIIDLASSPGGVDLEAAEKLEVKVISALGLPGKVAPITAAKVIKETIYNVIREMEV